MELKDVKSICDLVTRQYQINLPLDIAKYNYNTETDLLEVTFIEESVEVNIQKFGESIELLVDAQGRIIFMRLKSVKKYTTPNKVEYLDLD